MNHYCMNAHVQSSVFIQENRQSNSATGLSFIPGSTLRGAVAMTAIRKGVSPADQEFQEVFLKNPVSFPDLLPSKDTSLAAPVPLTATSCKRYPGFLTEGKHGVRDTLAILAAAVQERENASNAFFCSSCGQDVKPFQGFWNNDCLCPATTGPVIQYHRHTGIDRHTGTVASSIFYVTQGISERRKEADGKVVDQHLKGTVWLSHAQYEYLGSWLKDKVFVGADRTRGMGELQITLEPVDPEEADIAKWDTSFRNLISRWSSQPIPDGLFFSIDLVSHAIFTDEFLRPSFDWLPDFPNVIPVTRVVRKHIIRGWQSAWNLPKPDDPAVAMGSVFLFLYTGNDRKGLQDYLTTLARTGIGLRRPEGFGKIHVCHPLHVKELI